MELLRFIKWWWNGKSSSMKTLLAFWGWIFTIPFWILLFGFKGMIIFFGGLISWALWFVGKELYRGVRKSWAKFQQERDAERDQIVRRLGGTVIDTVQEERIKRHEDFVNRVLARIKRRTGI